MSAVSFSNPPQHFNPAIAFCGGAGAPSNPQGRLFLFVHLVTVYKSKYVWYSGVAPLNKWHRGWDPTFTWRLCRLSSETRCLRPVVFHYSIFVQLKLNKENVLSYFYWRFITALNFCKFLWPDSEAVYLPILLCLFALSEMAKMIPLRSGSALLNLQALDLDSDTALLFLKSTPPHHLWNLL